METIKIERIVFGSLANKIADTTIAYSPDVSPGVQEFNTMFDSDVNKQLATDYASFVKWLSPKSLCHTFLHIQGNDIIFENDGRYFATRCVYEVSRDEMQRIQYDYPALLEKIPRMQKRNETAYGENPAVQVEVHHYDVVTLNSDERLLYSIVSTAILKNRQVYIRLDPTVEDYRGNQLLNSSRLKSILKVFSTLESVLAEYASVAFSVDATFRSIANSIPDTLVIAHQDSLDHWEHQPDDIIADWRGEKLTTNSTLIENGEKTVRSMALLPILKNYINKEANTSCQNIFQYVQRIQFFLDEAIDESNPSNNAIRLLDLAYSGCRDKNAYRHEEMAGKLLRLLGEGKKMNTTLSQIMGDYGNKFKRSDNVKSFYKSKALQAKTLEAMEQLLSEVKDNKEVNSIIKSNVLKDWKYIDDLVVNHDKYPKLEALCLDSIRELVKVKLSIAEMCNKERCNAGYMAYIGVSKDDLLDKVDGWDALEMACTLIGYGYATILSAGYEKWKVEGIEQLNHAKEVNERIQGMKRNPKLNEIIAYEAEKVLGKGGDEKRNEDQKEGSGQPINKLIATLRQYHLDYLLVALLAGVAGFMLKPSDSKAVVVDSLPPAGIEVTDTIFIDVDLNQDKISRQLLVNVAHRSLERVDSNWKERVPILSLHGDTCTYNMALVNTRREDYYLLDSVLYGNSLKNKFTPSNKDSLSVNGSDSIYTLTSKHHLLEQMYETRYSASKLKIANDTTFLFDNNSFESKYNLAPSFEHLLYYFYVVDKMESWRKECNLKYEFCY